MRRRTSHSVFIRTFVVTALTMVMAATVAGPAAAGLASGPWPMFQGDGRHTGRSAYSGPRDPVLKWSFRVDGMPASPVIGADGTIYLPTGMLNDDTAGHLYAIDPGGTQKWRIALPGLPSSTAPAIAADGTIYVHMNGDEGNIAAVEKLCAVSPQGSLKWVFKPNGDLASYTSGVQSSPVIAPDGTVYVGSMNTALYALRPGDGSVKWAVSPSQSSITSSPALAADGTVYFLDAGFELWAYGPGGALKWSAPLSEASGGDGSPSVAADGTVYVATSGNEQVHAVTPAGAVKWSRDLGFAPVATPAIAADGTVYVNDDGLYALRPDGSVKWKMGEDVSFSSTSPVIDADGTVYWRGSWELMAVAADGRLKWRLPVPAPSSGSNDPSVAIGADGTLYVPRPDVFEPSNQTLAAYGERPVPARPVIAGVRPASGKRGATVTVSGTGFGARRGASVVRFGNTKCTRYLSWSDTLIRCAVPARAPLGAAKVSVTTPAGRSNAVAFRVRR